MNEMIEMLDKGGPVVWVLAAYSFVGLAIVLERYFLFLRLRRLPRNVSRNLDRLLDSPSAQAAISDLTGPEARIIQGMVEAV